MEYLSYLTPHSRALMLLFLSIACAELAIFAFWRIRRLLCEVRVAWLAGNRAARLRRIRERARLVSDEELTQGMGEVAMACQNRSGDQYTDPRDLEEGLKALQEYLETH